MTEEPTVFIWRTNLNRLVMLLGVILVGHSTLPIEYSNIITPIAFTAACGYTCVRVIRHNHLSILSPIPILLVGIATFFGFGSLASSLSTDATKAVINASFVVTPDGHWRVIFSNVLGTICIVAGLSTVLLLFSKYVTTRVSFARPPSEESMRFSLLLFAGIGLIVYFGFVLPANIGVLNITVPGFLQQVGQCAYVAIIQSAYMYVQHGRRYLLPFCVITIAMLFASFSLFMKEAVILTVALPFVGMFLASKKVRHVFIGGALISAVFILLVPIVTECRSTILSYSKGRADDVVVRASFENRVYVFLSSCAKIYTEDKRVSKKTDETQRWWSRLCYNSPQSFVMDRYDSGLPSNSLDNAFVTVIPRLIWPSKPITARVAVDFQQLYTRRWYDNTTSIGIGVFGESYWIGGWIGVIVICTLVGIEIGVLACVAAKHINQNDHMLMLPVLGAGLMIARGVDKFIILAFIGSVPIFVSIYLITIFLRNLVQQITKNQKSFGT